jgi:Protein of unknown function (DUF3435)
MHEDYQMAYCPIAHITALASTDNAFENARLLPEILHKPRVPGRLHVLRPLFKKSILNASIFRNTVQSVSSVHTNPARPMLYRTANDALKRLGEIAMKLVIQIVQTIQSRLFRRKFDNQDAGISHISRYSKSPLTFTTSVSSVSNFEFISDSRALIFESRTLSFESRSLICLVRLLSRLVWKLLILVSIDSLR